MTELFRVVDADGGVYSGYNNVLGVYRSERTARVQLNQRLKHRKANQEYRARTNKEPIQYPELKIQRTEVKWEDVK